MATERPEMSRLPALPCFGGASASSTVEKHDPADLAAPCDASARQIMPPDKRAVEEGTDEDDDDDGASCEDFEFTFATSDASALPSVTADEIFSGGWILPVYPVFSSEQLPAASAPTAAEEDVADRIPIQRLLIEEEMSAEPSSEKPPSRCRKSASTGSSGLRWRLRDMVVGRSHSDGKEKFVFLEAAHPAPPPSMTQKKEPNLSLLKSTEKAAGPGRGKGVKNEVDMVTPHRLHYGKGKKQKAVDGPRRSFLPYRQELLGLFAPVTGLRRTYQPF